MIIKNMKRTLTGLALCLFVSGVAVADEYSEANSDYSYRCRYRFTINDDPNNLGANCFNTGLESSSDAQERCDLICIRGGGFDCSISSEKCSYER